MECFFWFCFFVFNAVFNTKHVKILINKVFPNFSNQNIETVSLTLFLCLQCWLWAGHVCLTIDFFMPNLLFFTSKSFSNSNLVHVRYTSFCHLRVTLCLWSLHKSTMQKFLSKSSLICELVFIYINILFPQWRTKISITTLHKHKYKQVCWLSQTCLDSFMSLSEANPKPTPSRMIFFETIVDY